MGISLMKIVMIVVTINPGEPEIVMVWTTTVMVTSMKMFSELFTWMRMGRFWSGRGSRRGLRFRGYGSKWWGL